MKVQEKVPTRVFCVGSENFTQIQDCGDIYLLPNEQVSFVTPQNRRYDFVRKNWGFYSTPSINSRLKNQGFKVALVKNELDRIFIMTVEEDKIDLFQNYCEEEAQSILEWRDDRPLNSE